MPSLPLDSTHSRTTSSVACHHRLWGAQMVERRPAWHAIIIFGLAHIVGQRRAWHVIITLRSKMRLNDVGSRMPSSPLGSTHGRTTSGVASHHLLCTTLTIERRPAWHAIIAFEKHTRSDDVGCGMLSSPLGKTNSWTTSGVACNNRTWIAFTHGRTTWNMA